MIAVARTHAERGAHRALLAHWRRAHRSGERVEWIGEDAFADRLTVAENAKELLKEILRRRSLKRRCRQGNRREQTQILNKPTTRGHGCTCCPALIPPDNVRGAGRLRP